MGFKPSRDLLRTASRIAIVAATAAALAGCSGTATLATDDDAARTATAMETAAPDTQDFVGGAAYWGARYEANREDTGAALNFARNLRMMGGARQAVAVLKDVVMKEPDDTRVLAEYGKALTASGRAKDALPFLSRSVQMQGDDWTTLSAYGVALDQTGSHATAREMYQAALTISPNNAVVESNLAMSMMLDGRLDQAEVTFRRLVARPDATAQMRQNLAMVETLRGNVVEAEQLAREDLAPSEATNNITVMRQFDARNAKINVQELPPPAPVAPAKTSAAPVVAPVIADAETPAPQSAEAQPAPKEPVKPKAPAYMMAPITDEGDQMAPAAPAAAEKSAQAAPAPQADAGVAPAQPAPQTKPIASNQATGKPTPVLRKTYDVYRRSSAVSIANASQ